MAQTELTYDDVMAKVAAKRQCAVLPVAVGKFGYARL